MSYLIADIGATNARFAHLAKSDSPPGAGKVLVLATGAFNTARSLVQAALERLEPGPLAGACFAVAGPVVDGKVEVTNGGLAFDARALEVQLGAPLQLVNDFYAQAMSVPTLQRLERIGGEPPADGPRAVKAVLGPGTGLGMGILVPEADGWRVLPSEGGHADLAPGNHLEQEVLSVLQVAHPVVCWETVLSGPGLVRLYEAVAGLWGVPLRTLTPEEISAQGVRADDPVCHQTLELFFALLGAAAGNLALTVCARGGVYIGGGIVPALKEFAVSSPLRRRFEERAELGEYLARIPLYLILDDYPGLLGAGACLAETTPPQSTLQRRE